MADVKGKIKRKNGDVLLLHSSADIISFNNTGTSLSSNNVQAALAELAQSGGGGGGSVSIISKTYAELYAMVQGGTLVAGQLYRMTDFVTKINGTYDLSALLGTTAYLPYAVSAEHPFDLILQAVSTTELDEHVVAIQHSGDSYFANNNLLAWDLKYTIYNDATKYSWADATNGKGVITYMKDEFGNEAYYDFKNVQYVMYALKSALVGSQTALVDTSLAYDSTLDSNNQETQPNRYGSFFRIYRALLRYQSTGSYSSPYARDYDFDVGANILGVLQFNTIDITFLSYFNAGLYYTFNDEDAGDLSKIGSFCSENKIGHTADGLTTMLNTTVIPNGLPMHVFMNNHNVTQAGFTNNIIKSSWGNAFGGGAFNNTLSADASFNTFGINFYDSLLGIYSSQNVLGNGCYKLNCKNGMTDSYFGSYCHSNEIDNVDEIMFGNQCQYNKLKGSSVFINFGNLCSRNSLFFVDYITLGNYCSDNIFNQYCSQITLYGTNTTVNSSNNIFNQGCNNITGNAPISRCNFGQNCSNITVNATMWYVTFEGINQYITIDNALSNSRFGYGCVYIEMSDEDELGNSWYCDYSNFVFEPGLRYVKITANSADDTGDTIENYHLHMGLSGSSTLNPLSISGRTFNEYSTDIYANNSQEIYL